MYEIYISNLVFTTNESKFPSIDAVEVSRTEPLLVHSDIIPNNAYKVVAGNLKVADNASGSLEITIAPNNSGYNKMSPLQTEVTVIKDGNDYWYGRLLTVDEDFWKQKKCVFEGELSYLLDSLQTPEVYNITGSDNNANYLADMGISESDPRIDTPELYALSDESEINIAYFLRRWLQDIIAKHNGVVEPYKRFTVGETPDYVSMETLLNGKDKQEIVTNFENTLDVIKSNLLDLGMDVHVVIRHEHKDNSTNYERVIDFVSGFLPNEGGVQSIDFGKNLLDYANNMDGSVFYTVIYPRGNTIEHQILDENVEYTKTRDSIIIEDKTYYEKVEDEETDTYVYRSVSTNGVEVPYEEDWYDRFDYFKSTDREVVKNKKYYKRVVKPDAYTYKQVIPESNDNPQSNKWYIRVDDGGVSGYGRPNIQDFRFDKMIKSYTYMSTWDKEVEYGKPYFKLNDKAKRIFGGVKNYYHFLYQPNVSGEVKLDDIEYLGYYFIVDWLENDGDPSGLYYNDYSSHKFRIKQNFSNYQDDMRKAITNGLDGYTPLIYAYRGDYITVVANLEDRWGVIDDYGGEKTETDFTKNTSPSFYGDKDKEQLLEDGLLKEENKGHVYRATEEYETNSLYNEIVGNKVYVGDYIQVVEIQEDVYKYEIVDKTEKQDYMDNDLWDIYDSDKSSHNPLYGNHNVFYRAKSRFKANELFVDDDRNKYVKEGDLIVITYSKKIGYRFKNMGQKFLFRLVTDIYEKAEINIDLFKSVTPTFSTYPKGEGLYYYNENKQQYLLANEIYVKYGRIYYHRITEKKVEFELQDTYIPASGTRPEYVSNKDPYKEGWFELLTEANKNECVTIVGQKTGLCSSDELYVDGQIGAVYNLNGLKKFGYIYNTADFNTSSPATLLKKAVQFFNKFKYEYMTIEVTALDLHYLNPDINSFELLQQVICRSEPHGLNTDPNKVLYFPVTEIDIDLLTPENTKYTLNSNVNKALSKTVSDSGKNFTKYVEDTKIPSVSEVLETAKSHADDIIKKSIHGSYASFVYDNKTFDTTNELQLKNVPVDPDNPSLGNRACGLRVADGPTDKEATHKWVWYAGGLGHYKKTPTGDYNEKVVSKDAAAMGSGIWSDKPNVAITMDGHVVADFITTGKLRLGGSGSDASLVVYHYDEKKKTDDLIGSWGPNGIKIYQGEIELTNGTKYFRATTDGHVEANDISIGMVVDGKSTTLDKVVKQQNSDISDLNSSVNKQGSDISNLTTWKNSKIFSVHALTHDTNITVDDKKPAFSVSSEGVVRIRKGSIGIGWDPNLWNISEKRYGAWNTMITEDGQINIRKGSIKLGGISKKDDTWNFYVDDTGTVAINKGSINLGKYTVGKVTDYYFKVTDNGVVTMNKGAINLGKYTDPDTKSEDYYFKVTDKGVLTAKKGTFSGKLEAATGTFNGSLYAGTYDDKLGKYPFHVTSGGVLHIGPYKTVKDKKETIDYYFKVSNTGSVTAEKGFIAGWTITSDGMKITNGASAVLAKHKIGCGYAGGGIVVLRGSTLGDKDIKYCDNTDDADKRSGFLQISNSGSPEECINGIRIYATGHVIWTDGSGNFKREVYLGNIPQ